MQFLAVVLAFVFSGYGFAANGVSGAITGAVATITIGSGLAIARAEPGTQVAKSRVGMRAAQRIGGGVAALAALGGAVYGGWSWGWAWSLGGFVGGAGISLFIGYLLNLGSAFAESPTRESESNWSQRVLQGLPKAERITEPEGGWSEVAREPLLNIPSEGSRSLSPDDLAEALVTTAYDLAMGGRRSVRAKAGTAIPTELQLMELALFSLSAMDLGLAAHLPVGANEVRTTLRSKFVEFSWSSRAESEGLAPRREAIEELVTDRLGEYASAADRIGWHEGEGHKAIGRDLGRRALMNISGEGLQNPDPATCFRLTTHWLAVATDIETLLSKVSVDVEV